MGFSMKTCFPASKACTAASVLGSVLAEQDRVDVCRQHVPKIGHIFGTLNFGLHILPVPAIHRRRWGLQIRRQVRVDWEDAGPERLHRSRQTPIRTSDMVFSLHFSGIRTST